MHADYLMSADSNLLTSSLPQNNNSVMCDSLEGTVGATRCGGQRSPLCVKRLQVQRQDFQVSWLCVAEIAQLMRLLMQ